MSVYVVDASVAIKLYIPERRSEQAVRFFSDEHEFIAPELLLAEFASVLWKKSELLKELTRNQSRTIMRALDELPFDYYYISDVIKTAHEIALATRITVYDSLYVALAALRNCQLMTDDKKLILALRQTPFAELVTSLSDY